MAAARKPKVIRQPKKSALELAQERVVTWATVHGAPLLLLEGWNPDDGTWTSRSRVGQMIAMISRGMFPSAAARVVSFQGYHTFLSRGQEYALDAPEDRDYIPVDIRPFIDFAVSIQQAEAYHEYTLVDVVHKGAKDDPKLALAMLGRRYGERWREQQAVFTPDALDDRDRAITDLIENDTNAAMALAALADKLEARTDREA